MATPSFVRFTMAITSIIFAYDGQKIYPEFISEMARPEELSSKSASPRFSRAVCKI